MAPAVKFNVQRSEPIFIPPLTPTPKELKRLSDLDNDDSLKLMTPSIAFFPPKPHMVGKDPAKLIKLGIAKALVFFYPLAGRIRDDPAFSPNLIVECTGEGALFIEADADITLSQLGHMLHPPYPYLNDILYEVPGMTDVIDCPILHVQVTRLKCGGFIIGIRYSNIMMDAAGITHFFNTVCELARGATQPSVLPVWDRHRLYARTPPRETCFHPEFEGEDATPKVLKEKSYRIFYFTSKEIAALRNLVPHNLQNSSSFELITGFLWRCRTISLQLSPDEKVRMIFAVNARDKFNPPLSKGYYGNAIAFAGCLTTVGELCNNFLGYAVELVANAKKNVTEEYMRSFIDGLVLRGWPRIPALMSSFFTSDLRRMGFLDTDLGWGNPVSSCPGYAWYEPYPQEESNYVLCRNEKGEAVTVVPICMPPEAMEIMEQEIYSTLKIRGITDTSFNQVIKSNL